MPRTPLGELRRLLGLAAGGLIEVVEEGLKQRP